MENRSDKIIAYWLLTGVGMLMIQIILGGITRLTGSGLSITEWDVVTGIIPPLNNAQWLDAFHKYQLTPQYHLLNANFTLHDFKFIFYWEWFHRLWGRIIGVVFLLPFLIFLVKRRFKLEMINFLVFLFLLGALQGAVGWIMVASGLTGEAIYVQPTKLAMHFVLATILLSYTYWFALQLLIDRQELVCNRPLKRFTWIILVVIVIQLAFGGLMAGHKAAPAVPTWPDMNGTFIPSYVFNRPEGWLSIIDNPIVIQFIHRTLAYLLFILICIWTVKAIKIPSGGGFKTARLFPAILVAIQLTLGVLTVLTSTRIRVTKWNIFEWMAQLHQIVAILLLLSMVLALFYLHLKQKANSESISIDRHLI
ncbi:MAG: COX15/CtaA family protein [Flavisolibacter sp.]